METAVDKSSDRPSPAPEPSGRSVLVRIAAGVLALRVALQLVGMLSVSRFHDAWAYALKMWVVWDAGHYLRIAKVGYRPETAPGDDPLYIVFFPGYPLAVRIASVVFRNLTLSGLVVSSLASVGCGWFLYKLVRIDGDHDEAWRAVVLLFAFPTAFFLAAPYSESLFLCAILASGYAARTTRFVRSAFAGVVATASRLAGVALLPALAVEAISSSRRWSVRARRVAIVGVAGAGLLAYLAINLVVHGDAFHFLTVQRRHWFQHAVWPWEPIRDAIAELIEGGHDSEYTVIYGGRLAAAAFALPLLLIAVRRLRFADALYGWAGFVLVLCASWLLSLPRYLLPLYPIFMVGAKLTRSPRLFWPVTIAGLAMQGWLMWRYVAPDWAF